MRSPNRPSSIAICVNPDDRRDALMSTIVSTCAVVIVAAAKAMHDVCQHLFTWRSGPAG